MKYIKTYCYAEHEIDFIKAQLIQSDGYVDYVVVYEYDVTHVGDPKPFRLESLIKKLDKNLSKRLIYRPVSVKHLCKQTKESKVVHELNEAVQRSYFFNDQFFNLNDEDIIIDCDVDEIIYAHRFKELFLFQRIIGMPVSIKLNQFFFKPTYLWTDAKFSSPTLYKFSWVKKPKYIVDNAFKVCHRRDLHIKYPRICGAHMSWIMPVSSMIQKLNSYSHPEYQKFADTEILTNAIKNKEYIFDKDRDFNIEELNPGDPRIVI